MLPAVLLAAVYLVWSPPSADLAAQTFRADLFEAHGFEVWSNAWYGGFHLPGYSLLFPPLADAIGLRLAGALSIVAATALFAALVRPHHGDRARIAVWLFGAGIGASLFTGRLTFALGVAVGLAALLAVDRDRRVAAAVLAALTPIASPVAGLFVAFAGGVLFLTGGRARGLILALPALAAILIVALLFPTGGYHPFSASTFVLIVAATLALVVIPPRGERTIRTGALLYLAFTLAAWAIETPVGGNAARLGALVAAPLLILGAWGRRPAWVIGLALVPLVYWQWSAPVRDLTDAVGEPSAEAAYYEPLIAQVERNSQAASGSGPTFRVHVPPTQIRWEAVHVAERFPLARGWLRQAESDDFDLFQDGNLTASSYREWLDERAVRFVAVSRGADPDYLAEDEIALIDAGLPYLEEVWSNPDWSLYEVSDPAPLAQPPARTVELSSNGFVLSVPAAGSYEVAVRHSPWFDVVGGSAMLSESGGAWTVVEATAAGTIEVEARFP